MPPKEKPWKAGKGRQGEFTTQDYTSIAEADGAIDVSDEQKEAARAVEESSGPGRGRGRGLGHLKGRGKGHLKHGDGGPDQPVPPSGGAGPAQDRTV